MTGGGRPPAEDERSVRTVLRSLIGPIYAPTVLESAGEGALLPVVPIIALHLGFSVPAAAALTMIAGLGAFLGPIPTARLMRAVGARRAIIGSGALLIAANIVALLWIGDGLRHGAGPEHRAALVVLLVVMSATSQVWALGRQSYLGTAIPPSMRARGMSTFGGMLRVGQVVGPMLGAVVLAVGHESWVFGLFAAMTTLATAMVVLFLVPDEESGVERRLEPVAQEDGEGAVPAREPSREVLRRMLRVGLGIIPVMMGRVNRPVIVPLLGAALDLHPTVVSVVFGIAAVIDLLMFVPAGTLMDRRGRAAVAVPCSALMGIGYLLLAVLAPVLGGDGDETARVIALLVPSVVIAVGNGLGAGIVMTLGIDVSPQRDRTRYLAWWNTLIGAGRLAAPLLVAGIALVAPLAAAGGASGVLCLGGAAWLARVLPELGRQRVARGE